MLRYQTWNKTIKISTLLPLKKLQTVSFRDNTFLCAYTIPRYVSGHDGNRNTLSLST